MTIDQSIFGLNYLSMANAPYCLLKLLYKLCTIENIDSVLLYAGTVWKMYEYIVFYTFFSTKVAEVGLEGLWWA